MAPSFRIIWIALFSLLPVEVWATEGGGFYTPETLPVSPARLEAAVRATVLLRSDVEYNTNCSAVLLSSDGYVATNLHCLKLCLNKVWGLYEPGIEQIGKELDGVYSFTRYPAPLREEPICPPYARSVMELESVGLKNPRLVWLGKGRQSHNEEKMVLISDEEFSAFSDLTEDIAILKYESEGTVPCLTAAEPEPASNSPVWLLGYPGTTSRGSEDRRLSISFGSVRASIKEDPILKSIATRLGSPLGDLLWKREIEMWDQSHLLLTSLDGFHGVSGGAIVSPTGDLVAIAFTMTALSKTDYQGSTLMGLKIGHLKTRLKMDLGKAKTDRIFSCK